MLDMRFRTLRSALLSLTWAGSDRFTCVKDVDLSVASLAASSLSQARNYTLPQK
jgi:hypothetical protein